MLQHGELLTKCTVMLSKCVEFVLQCGKMLIIYAKFEQLTLILLTTTTKPIIECD